MTELGGFDEATEQIKKPKISERSTSREIIKDNVDIIEVIRGTYGIASGSKEHTLIKTLHLNPCVGVFYYDPEQKIAGAIHIRENRSKQGVSKDLDVFIKALAASGSQKIHNASIHIIGGWKEESLASYTISSVLDIGFKPEQIITNQRSEHEIPNLYTMQGRSIQSFSTPQNIALDAKTGTLYDIKNRLPSKYANTGSAFNLLKMGRASITPDPRSL